MIAEMPPPVEHGVRRLHPVRNTLHVSARSRPRDARDLGLTIAQAAREPVPIRRRITNRQRRFAAKQMNRRCYRLAGFELSA
jgi:hypothetical protein